MASQRGNGKLQFPPARLSICPADDQGNTKVREVGPDGVFSVGRAEACDVRIDDDPAVSRRHVQLHAHAGCLRITVFPGARAPLVNGRSYEEKLLADGDIIRLGDTLISVTYPKLDGDPTNDPKGGGSAGVRSRVPGRADVVQAVAAVAAHHDRDLAKVRRGALDEELGEFLRVKPERARKLLDELAGQLGVPLYVRGTARYVAVAERLNELR